ncbi:MULTISPECIES: hypothetical protein [unclassified Coleofasciculus]|uniref:hypothetical protein n=1 Tax=unclassified Coleofasciculus TaxID=2692782 RepID=UPI001882A50C|nr:MULTISPECIES: hypothetical protein [unclassified Coleofasciculus]MBE9125519.1 hypothetical protein [Coleofasciculus sp. LEGE 07081]MBE9148617.1 hypothetical protein [Coleofasciculus sp. LEGE 07092]
MRLLIKLVGLALVFAGIYFLGQNIFFTTQISPYWWRDISATGSVLAILAGLVSLLFFRRETGGFGWILVILGIVLVFISGSVILKPTSLWYFFLSFASVFAGLQLIRTGRFNF